MEEIKEYRAVDGKRFSTEQKCLAHERKIERLKKKFRLSLEIQLEVVRDVRVCFFTNRECLCFLFDRILFYHLKRETEVSIAYYMPIYTHENAMKNTTDCCEEDGNWWPFNEKGHEQRLVFLDWMISELEKQIKEENNK